MEAGGGQTTFTTAESTENQAAVLAEADRRTVQASSVAATGVHPHTVLHEVIGEVERIRFRDGDSAFHPPFRVLRF